METGKCGVPLIGTNCQKAILEARISALSKEVEEAQRTANRWKGIVREARNQSGKWGEQARWQLPDPDWRPKTKEELAQMRASPESEHFGLSPATVGKEETGSDEG